MQNISSYAKLRNPRYQNLLKHEIPCLKYFRAIYSGNYVARTRELSIADNSTAVSYVRSQWSYPAIPHFEIIQNCLQIRNSCLISRNFSNWLERYQSTVFRQISFPMAPQATEIAYITLKPGVELEGTSASAQAWQESIATIQRQEGYQRLYYGRTIESPDILILMIGTIPVLYPISRRNPRISLSIIIC